VTNELKPSLEPSVWWRSNPGQDEGRDLAALVMRNELERHENFRRPRRSSLQKRRDARAKANGSTIAISQKRGRLAR
jgi:hypothetical protein